MEIFDKLYINVESTRLLQRSEKYYDEYKQKKFPNNSHIHIIPCDDSSSYHCPYSMTVPKNPNWDCILNYCSEYPEMKLLDL